MKYQNLKSFQKHLASAAPHHLCRVYLVAIEDDFERLQALNGILFYLGAAPPRFIPNGTQNLAFGPRQSPGIEIVGEGGSIEAIQPPSPTTQSRELSRRSKSQILSPVRYSGADCDLRAVLDAVQSASFFGESVVVFDEVEKLSKKQMQSFCDHCTLSAGYLLLGARSKTPLFSLVEKEGVILDLLEEKPWDKEKRLTEQLVEQAKKGGKKLASDGALLLFEKLGMDSCLLQSEVERLICYVGDRPVITRDDILCILPASRVPTVWQTAEALVWEGGEIPSVENATFHGLIPLLRNQLHLGLTLATLIEEKCPADQWSRYLPKLWSKTLEKRSSQAERLGSSYFRKGLQKLFEIELLSRSNSTQYGALLDLFRAYSHVR